MSAKPSSWQTLSEFSLPSQAGSDRLARDLVALALQSLNLPPSVLERLKTAVAEATLNAIEHGNRYRPDLPVSVRVQLSEKAVTVQVIDQGTNPISTSETPDITAKVSGQEPPRGWGFFLIERMVDDIQISSDSAHHTIELFLYLEDNKTAQKREKQK